MPVNQKITWLAPISDHINGSVQLTHLVASWGQWTTLKWIEPLHFDKELCRIELRSFIFTKWVPWCHVLPSEMGANNKHGHNDSASSLFLSRFPTRPLRHLRRTKGAGDQANESRPHPPSPLKSAFCPHKLQLSLLVTFASPFIFLLLRISFFFRSHPIRLPLDFLICQTPLSPLRPHRHPLKIAVTITRCFPFASSRELHFRAGRRMMRLYHFWFW